MSTLFYVDTSFTTDDQQESPWFIDRLRYSAFGEAKLGLVDRCLHKLIHDRYSAIDHGTILHRAIEGYPALIWRKTKAGCRT